jgi:hypothetical protein
MLPSFIAAVRISVFGTKRTSGADETMSVDRGRREVAGGRQTDAIDPKRTCTYLAEAFYLMILNDTFLAGSSNEQEVVRIARLRRQTGGQKGMI